MLPKDYDKIKLDIFFQYQWQIKGDAKKTYLELPKKMAYGKWLMPAQAPSEGSEWKEIRHNDPASSTPIALKYVDGENNIHPFVRGGWFMLSAFSKEQIDESADSASIEGNAKGTGTEDQSGW